MESSAQPTPVVVVGIDTADHDRIERLVAEGRMPHLTALLAQGRRGHLEPWPPAFYDMVWPSFNTGRELSEHGWYYGKLWRPERMCLELVRPDWLPQSPFWTGPDFCQRRIGLVDVPFAPTPTDQFSGVYINGWQCHDGTVQHIAPKGLEQEIAARFGGRILSRVDPFGPQDAQRLRRIRNDAIAATTQVAEICAWLQSREAFDLFVVVLGGAHRAGHYAYSLSEIDASKLSDADRHSLATALDDVYVACDAALGRIVSTARQDARILVCAMHGMGPEAGWSEQLPRLLGSMIDVGAPGSSGHGALSRAKSLVPHGLVRFIRECLPAALLDASLPLWSRRMHDWPTTRCFALPCDLGGFIRINLRGRERDGIVEPGAEYDELCNRLTEGFLSFRDIESGHPVVQSVDRVDEQIGTDAPARPWLPDLVVRWGKLRAIDLSGVRSDLHGEVRWQRNWRLVSGRSGNHKPRGWFVATGYDIEAGVDDQVRRSTDLSRMVQSWMG